MLTLISRTSPWASDQIVTVGGVVYCICCSSWSVTVEGSPSLAFSDLVSAIIACLLGVTA